MFTSMIFVRDVVYNKATDDFTVSVKDLKRDIVMDGERLVIITPTPSQPRRRPPPLSPGSTTWWSPPATTRCPTCPPSPASRSSPAGFFMPTTSGFPHCLCLHRRSCCTSHIDIIFASASKYPLSNPQGCHRVCWKATSSGWLKLLCRGHRSSMSQVFQLITILTIEYPSASLICS